MEPDYSGTNESARNFSDFLDSQFELNRPYEANPIENTDIGIDYKTTAPYWHEVMKDHFSSKPSIPKIASAILPRANTAGGGYGDNHPRHGGSGSGILNAQQKEKSVYHKPQRCNRLLGSESISGVVKQGWSIAKVLIYSYDL